MLKFLRKRWLPLLLTVSVLIVSLGYPTYLMMQSMQGLQLVAFIGYVGLLFAGLGFMLFEIFKRG